jgi:Uma2 family endonuclease
VRLLIDVIDTLNYYFADEPNVYVGGNMMMYYVEGDPKKTWSSDVFVVRGIPNEPPRRVWKIWEEKAPDFVIELSSRKTARKDQREKFTLYQDVLRVPEYFLFDPLGEFLTPSLVGYRLGGQGYERIAAVDGRVPSEVAGLLFEGEGEDLRLYDPVRRVYLKSPQEARKYGDEAALARSAAEAALARETQARAAAEAELEQLRREIERLRGRLK